MHVLWAPWRMAYIGAPAPAGCLFCTASTTPDRQGMLVLAQQPVVAMLNRYPYASGHLMVAPRSHTADLAALATDEYAALMRTLQRAVTIVRDEFQPDGINVGMNIGAAAGAGIADHLHWHIVPRWIGDTNFMPMLTDVRVLPEHLDATYARLEAHFRTLEPA